jgi:Fur family ferric uptake transcriptional regulator
MASDSAALLRERGIQVTAQRLAVLRAVSREPHITADAVAEVVRTKIGAISLQSVYDALALLVAEGLLRRIQPSGSPARFEDRVHDNHHHLICRTCGRVVDVDCAVGAAPCLTARDDQGYEIDEAEVAYWGRCPECVEQSRTAAPTHQPHDARQRRRRNAGASAPAESTRISRSNTRRPRRTSKG